jgi:hypothetical protein
MKISLCYRVIITSVLATTVAIAAPLQPLHTQIVDPEPDDILQRSEHVVYTETNDIANAVLAFRRDDEGRLTQNTATPCGRASGLCRVIGTGDDGTSLSVPSSASTAST